MPQLQENTPWNKIDCGIEAVTPRGAVFRMVQSGDIIEVTRELTDQREENIGTLMHLLGGIWLASKDLDPGMLDWAGSAFTARWGRYWVFGKRQYGKVLAPWTHRVLTAQFHRYQHELPCAKRKDLFLFAIERDARHGWLQVHTSVRPYRETILWTDKDLHAAGWDQTQNQQGTIIHLAEDWKPAAHASR